MSDHQKLELGRKILITLICFYVSIDLASDVVAQRLVPIGHLTINASAFCYPFTFLVNDVITELFGFSYGRLTIWLGVLADWVFVGIIIGLISLPSPDTFHRSIQFHQVLDPMARMPFAEIPGILLGRFVNIYFLAKSKILLNSRFFWLRSVLCSFLGAVIRTSIVNFLIFLGIVNYSTIASIIGLHIITDMIAILFLSWISFGIVYFLKNKLNIDQFNYKEKFNPFML